MLTAVSLFICASVASVFWPLTICAWATESGRDASRGVAAGGAIATARKATATGDSVFRDDHRTGDKVRQTIENAQVCYCCPRFWESTV